MFALCQEIDIEAALSPDAPVGIFGFQSTGGSVFVKRNDLILTGSCLFILGMPEDILKFGFRTAKGKFYLHLNGQKWWKQ